MFYFTINTIWKKRSACRLWPVWPDVGYVAMFLLLDTYSLVMNFYHLLYNSLVETVFQHRINNVRSWFGCWSTPRIVLRCILNLKWFFNLLTTNAYSIHVEENNLFFFALQQELFNETRRRWDLKFVTFGCVLGLDGKSCKMKNDWILFVGLSCWVSKEQM